MLEGGTRCNPEEALRRDGFEESPPRDWRQEKILVKPVDPHFAPIVPTGADEGELQMIAELVDVLGG